MSSSGARDPSLTAGGCRQRAVKQSFACLHGRPFNGGDDDNTCSAEGSDHVEGGHSLLTAVLTEAFGVAGQLHLHCAQSMMLLLH